MVIRFKPRRLFASLGAACLFAANSPVQAQNYTWSSSAPGGNWSQSANWGGSAPSGGAPTTTLTFGGTTTAGLTSSNDIGNLQVNSITFNSTAGAYSISGNAIQFLNSGSTITQNSNSNISLPALTISNGLSINGSGTGTLTVNSLAFNSGGAENQASLDTGSKVLVLNGDMSLDGSSVPNAVTVKGTIQLSAGNHTFNGLNYTRANAQDIVFSNVFQGSGGITYTGIDSVAITGVSTYTGATIFSSTTANYLGATNALPSASAVTVNSTLQFFTTDPSGGVTIGNFSQNIGSLAGAGSVNMGSASLTTGNDNTNTTFSGILSDDGSGSSTITKVGTGTWTLSGTNTFTGQLVIANGTVAVGSFAAPGNSSNLGATAASKNFILGGNGTTGFLQYTGSSAASYSRNFTLATGGSGGFLGNLGDLTLSGTISGSGNLIKAGTNNLILSGTNTFTGSITVTGGNLSLTGTANSSGNINLLGGKLTLDNTASALTRLGTTPTLTLNMGELNIIGNTVNPSGNIENFGALNVIGGTSANNRLTLTNSGSALQVTFSSLNVSNGSNLLIRGDNLGGSSGSYTRVLFTSAPGTTSAPLSGVLFDNSSSGTGLGLAAYSSTLGIVQFTAANTTGNIIDNINSPNTSTIANFTTGNGGSTLTINAGATIAALNFSNEFSTANFKNLYGSSGNNANAPAGTLVVSSGLIQVLNTATNVTVNGDTGGSTLSTAGGFTFNLNQNLTFASNMTLSAAGLTKLGAGSLVINGTNSIAGDYNISSGSVSIAGATTAGNLNISGSSVASFNSASTLNSINLSGTATVNLAGGSAGSISSSSSSTSLNLTGNLTLTGNSTTTFAGVISGGSASLITSSGSTGTLTLTNSNTFGGGLAVNGGTVYLANGNSAGTGTLTLNGGTVSYSGGTTTLAAAGLSFGTSGSSTLQVTTAGTVLTVAGVSGSGSWTFDGGQGITSTSRGGTLLINSTSASSGGSLSVIGNGLVQLGANNALPSGINLNVTPGNVSNVGAGLDLQTFNQTVGNITATLGTSNSPITGQPIVQGSGTLTLNGDVSIVTSGSASYPLTINPSVVLSAGNHNFSTQAGGNSDVFHGDLQFLGSISGAGSVTLPSTSQGIIDFEVGNTYTGTTSVLGGTLYLRGNNAIPSTSAVTQAAGTVIDFTGGNVLTSGTSSTFGSLTGAGSIILGSSSILTIGADNTSPAAYTGAISGGGSLTKIGTGTLILSGTNTYTGGTNVNAGSLRINGSLSTGAVQVSQGAIIGGNGTINGTLTVAAGGTIDIGSAPATVGTLRVGGSVTINGGTGGSTTNWNVDINGTTTSSADNLTLLSSSAVLNFVATGGNKINIQMNDLASGMVVNNDYTFKIATVSTGTGSTNIQSNGGVFTASQFTFSATNFAFTNQNIAINGDNLIISFTVIPVPEPATLLVFGSAGLGMLGWMRKRKNRKLTSTASIA